MVVTRKGARPNSLSAGVWTMMPLWIYQQRRSGLGGHKLCYRTCRRRLAPPPTLAHRCPLPHLAAPSRRFPPSLHGFIPRRRCFAPNLPHFPSPPGHFSPFVVIAAFRVPSLRRARSSNSLSLRRPSSSSSTFLLPADSPPGFESPLPLGTRCRWVRLPAMCYRSRCRCRRRRPFAGIASPDLQVVVAAPMWVVDTVWRSLGVSWGLGGEVIREERTTRVVVCFRNALDGTPTCWVNRSPLVFRSLQFHRRATMCPPTSLWKGEGRVRLSSSRTVDG